MGKGMRESKRWILKILNELKNREHLANLSPINQMNLLEIDSSLFCLSLDATTNNVQLRSAHSTLDELTNAHWDDHLHNTAYGERGHNRWFDKTVAMSVESNTRLGMMGEHSPCDALVPSILGEFCVNEPMEWDECDPVSLSTKPQGWRQLKWETDSHIIRECRRVEKESRQLVEDSDDSQLWFDEFGVEWMRAGR
jgi:carnitine O-acetyltransferase